MVAAVLLLLVAGGGGVWLLKRGGSDSTATLTSTVSTGTFKTTVSASGTVAAAREADLSFEVSGTVATIPVSEGQKVSKGEVLATVGRTSLRASLAAAESSLTAAQSQLDDDVDADASDTQLAADRASVLSAKASLASAKADYASGKLRSTINGTVASVDVSVGDQVPGSSSSSGSSGGSAAGAGTATSTADTSTTSTAAVTVVSTQAFIVDATVASSDVASVKKGMQAQITVTGVDSTVYGTVSSIGLVAQTSSSGAAEFPVEIAVTGSPTGVYSGASADASIIVKQASGVLTVATQALHTSGSTTYVNRLVKGKPVRTTVKIGTTYGLSTEVKSGLKSGDEVELGAFTRPTGTGAGGANGGGGAFGAGGFTGGGNGNGGGFGGQAPGQ